MFDTVGRETLHRSWGVLKPQGRMVTVAVESKSETDDRVRQAFFIVEPNGAQLIEITKLFETGKLQTALNQVVPVSAATSAYAGTLAKQGRGKVVVSTREWPAAQTPSRAQVSSQ